MKNRVLLKSALLLLLIAANGLVTASEDDDLIFDPDGKQLTAQTPLIETQQDQSLLHRIKRGLWSFFGSPASTTTTTTTQAPPDQEQTIHQDQSLDQQEDQDQDIDESVFVNTKDGNHTVVQPEESSVENGVIERLTLNNGDGDDNGEEDEHNNEVEDVAESRRMPVIYGNSDDEDLAGSGDIEGSAGETDLDNRVHAEDRHTNVVGPARFYRVTLTVSEPYRREYSDRNSPEYRELSNNLTKAIENLYNRHIPNYNYFANVVKISPTSDAFTSQVTLDIGSTFTDEHKVRDVLEQQLLQYHSLGSIQVGPEGFSFRIFQAGEKDTEPECDQSAELMCKSGACVPLESRCDGVLQCDDGSDEDNCPTELTSKINEDDTTSDLPTETPGDNKDDEEIAHSTLRPFSNTCRADDTIRCSDGSRYICSVQECDGVQDCDDGGDELNCSGGTGCDAGEFACDVNRCILEQQRCNFIKDCQDGSDEHDCHYPACSPAEFICKNRQCIDRDKYCNGVQDCYDGSDEHNCQCRDDQFECAAGFCVPISRRCDGFTDCIGGGDEQNCPNTTRCRADEFECDNGSCVSKSARCDGRNDCHDHSDEYNCTVTTCSGDQYRCMDGICLSIDKRCNGVADCRNGEDESQCGCGEAEFRCTDGRCIGYELQCNGVNECSDGSDERDCERRKFHNAEKLAALARTSSAVAPRGRGGPAGRRGNTSRPAATTESGRQLAVGPFVTISDSMLEMFPEESQPRAIPDSLLRKPAVYLANINGEWRDDERAARLGAKAGAKNRRGPLQPERPGWSDDLVRSVILRKHNGTLKKAGGGRRETNSAKAPGGSRCSNATTTTTRVSSWRRKPVSNGRGSTQQGARDTRSRKKNRAHRANALTKTGSLKAHKRVRKPMVNTSDGSGSEGIGDTKRKTAVDDVGRRAAGESFVGISLASPGGASMRTEASTDMTTSGTADDFSSTVTNRLAPEGAKVRKNDFRFIKTESLVYESNSPNVELRRSFPKLTNDIDEAAPPDPPRSSDSPKQGESAENAGLESFVDGLDDKIDSGLLSSDETTEPTTARDFAAMSEARSESRETLEEESRREDYDVLLSWTETPSSTTAMTTVTTEDAPLTRQASEDESGEMHNKRKHKGRRNERKNNGSKRRGKKRNKKRKNKQTTVPAGGGTPSSVDDDERQRNTEATSTRNDPSYGEDASSDTSDRMTTEDLGTQHLSVDERVTEDFSSGPRSAETTQADLSSDDAPSTPSTASDENYPDRGGVASSTESGAFTTRFSSDDEDAPSQTTGSHGTSADDGDSSASDQASPSVEMVETSAEVAEEPRSSPSPSTSTGSNERRSVTGEPWSGGRGSDEEEEEPKRRAEEDTTAATTGGTIHNEFSDLDSEEEYKDTSEATLFLENEDAVTSAGEADYEVDNCDKNQHACDEYTCIDEDKLCNGIVDCINASDEVDCDYIYIKRLEQHLNGHSTVGTFAPATSRNTSMEDYDIFKLLHFCNDCIRKLNICDGESNCADGSYRKNSKECPDDKLPCDNGVCINKSFFCDRNVDCLDASDERNCPETDESTDTDKQCPHDSFACNDGSCIPQAAVCDGRADCPHDEDEINCRQGVDASDRASSGGRPETEVAGANPDNEAYSPDTDANADVPPTNLSTPRSCAPDDFVCADGTCIPETHHCDHFYDCRDFTDEQYCFGCTRDQFQCANGDCINADQRCNGYIECADGSDEPEECEPPAPGYCAAGQFMCISDRRCVPHSSLCNGIPECRDGSDEENCGHRRDCTAEEWRCKSGDCVPRHQRCDRRIDCPYDDSDELDCGYRASQRNHSRCRSHEWQCNDGHCIAMHQRCDKKLDCPRDMSDEIGCSYESHPTDGASELRLKTYPSEQVIKENPAKQGREVVFQCRDEGLLRARVRWMRAKGLPLPPGSRDINGRLEIPNIQLDHAGTYICEAVGYSPSTPGSQLSVSLEVEKFEQPVTRPPQVCQYDEATCSNGDCIPKTYVCDGKFDCTDGSDEMRCSPHGCEPNEFRCNNKQCVSKLWRCDGDKDCADGSDEESCSPSPPGSACRYSEFACSSNKQCIPKSYHCDMERDCLDGSDELGCSPVYIVKAPPPMVVLEPGDVLILTCTAVGVPIPEINWRLNWGHIPSKCTTTSINGTGTLTCPDIQPENQGAYSCEALNIGGFVFAVPDAIVVVKEPGNICPKGKFNSEAKNPEDCISCFCFGVTSECRSADLFTYHIPPPFDRHKIVSVEAAPVIKIHSDISSQISQIRPLGRDGVQLLESFSNDLNAYNIPYFALPENYHGSQLKSYGGYLKYSIRHTGNGTPNDAPNVILSGNNYILIHKGRKPPADYETEESVRFFYGEWYRQEGRSEFIASREEIMMTLANVDNILIKVKYDDSPQLDVRLTNIVMDTADVRNTGLGSASYVEECQCPSGYTGLSCEHCAPGYLRRENGPWLGQCYRDEPPCPPGNYGDPSRNIPCQICPCPLTNPSNQFARTCHLGSDGQPTCDCPAGYVGRRCQQCATGYQGNPLIPGDMCVPVQQCDPHGSLSPNADPHTGKCHCKEYATGLTCNQCKANTFNLASANQFGCIACFCMGITNRCISSNWYRNEIRVSFTNSLRDFSLIESKSMDAPAIIDGIRLDTISREITYSDFPNRGNNDVYYWQLPSIFLGDQITSYGGNLKYTVRYVPSPGGQSSRNNAADVELISANDINLLYYSRESPEPNFQQSFTVPLLEQYWQRNDGTQADREHLLMALADVRAIRIKATYTTHTDEAALSFVSLDTAEKYNTGKERAVEVEECTCPAGYRGLSCEDCDVGYTRAFEGLYLGICEPCQCNGHSNQCDPETGTCENCAHHTTGESCEVCEPGYEGDATRGTPSDCTSQTSQPGCRCNEAGSRSRSCVDGRCECKRNVEGPECNRCRPSTYGLRAENIDGCIECYCSGVTDQCHESTLYIQQIPMWVYDSRHGFTLTDSTRRDVIADGFELNVAMNEIGYRYPDSRNRRLFWSLPSVFTGNKVKSYGGNLTLTQHITAYPEAKSYKDQDILLIGNGITLFWTNPTEIQPDIPMTYTVPLKENEWRRLTTEGPRSASRTDLMIVLSNLEAILVRASHSERMTATYISDISMDTAVENLTGNRRATQIEACRCPTGYLGSSCETCARGYYRDTNDRSVSYLGACNPCPCNKNEESCEISRSGQVKCHCLPGYTGLYCQEMVGETSTTTPGPIPPARIIVYVQEPEFQIVQTGNIVRYHCTGRSQDSELVRIRWEKEGGQLPPGRSVDDANGLLVIRDVKVSDSGIYVCQVSDGINIAIKKVTLTVGAFPKYLLEIPGANPVAPTAVITPHYQQVQEGRPVEFRCEATGNPPPQLDWVRVHGTMSPEATFYNGVWSLPAASKSDAAEYKCIARNNVGTDEKTTVLYVQDNPDKPPLQTLPPTVTPSEWSGTSGDAVRLICTPSQRANITWTRSGGLPLPSSASQRDGILTIVNPNPSDSGIYVCTSTDLRGTETSTTAKIVIVPRRDPPTIKVKPERQVVSQGTVAEVRCITSGESGVHVKWSKYTETMSPRVQQVDDTLRIVNAQVSDRGVYICRVSSAAGSYEASAIIEVAPREAPVLELYPQDVQTVILGGSADLQCRAKAGFPVPELHWSRQDSRPFASNIEQLPGGLLRLSNITANDGGAYICAASNEVGSTSVIAHIEVQSMPVITITPRHGILQVKRGGRVRLMCSASGHPQPNVAWSKHVNGMTVYDTYSRTAATPLSAVYEIFSVSPDDEGSYTCQATNAVGIAEERIQIRIEDDNDVDNQPCTGDRGDIPCPPDDRQPRPDHRDPNQQGVLIPEDYLRIPNGGKVEMRCQVFGPDGDHIYLDWKRSDHRSLPEGSTVHNGVLSIPTVDRTAAGEYICLGLDPAGAVLFRAKSHLEIISPPRIELNPTRQTVGPGENPSIVCTATGDEPLRIEWEAIGRPLPYSVTHHNGVLQFHGITYSDAGKYVCKATNGAGTAEAVAEVSVNEHSYDDTRIRAEHRDVTTYAGSSVRLRCDVRERATIHWSRDGQALPITARIGEDYLELMQVKPEDSGRYICQAQTSRGVSSDYINFNVSLYRSQCRHWEYECRSLQCIPKEYFCDGYVQCSDGTDERFCRNLRYRQFLQRRRAVASPLVSVEVSQDPINIGDTVDIHCTCTGTRNPRYHWSRPNHTRLPTNAQIYGNVLRLTNVAVDDSGPYRCVVDTPEGTFEKDLNLIVHGGNNDEPAIETKFAPYGSSLEMDCRIDLDPPIQFQWNKLGGLLPRNTQTLENKLKLTNVKAEDAGTYICLANNGHTNIEVPTVLVVTGVVPNFNQAPESYVALPPLPDSYLKFNIEVSFKPESSEGILLYNDESGNESGDFIVLSLINGYPQFKFNLGSGPAVVRADRPVALSEWHTIKIQRNRKEGTMLVDGEGPYKVVAVGRRQGLDLKEPLYVGGVPSYNRINKEVEINSGFVGCISRLVLGEKQIDLIGDQTDSVGITNCETCAENPCNNGGVCQEASTKNGYTCLCRAGFSGKHCDFVGQSCYPGACGEGKCVDKETGFDCYCPLGKRGPRCQYSVNVHEPAFHDEKAFLAHDTPKALRRLKVAMSFNPTDTGDGILMYCSQSDEGLGDFAALVIRDQHVEFRFDIGSGEAVIRSPYTIQPGVWTYVTVNRDFKEAKLSVNGEPFVEGKAPGASRTMTLNTPLYIGGVDRRKIVVNKKAGVDWSFRGCISELEVSSNNVDILRSAIDSANIEDCSTTHPNQTVFQTTVTTPASTQPPTTPYNPCSSNPCVHGVCQSSNAYDYSCTCEYGYVGRNCENVLKQCELLTPCRNGGTCTNLHGSYKCDCRLGYNGQNCEKLAEITYDVAFRGDGWLELDRSVMTHEEERNEVLGLEISTNKSNGLIMWHGQTPNDLTPDDYIAVAVVDGYVEYQYNLGSGPAVIRVTTQRVDDGERHRIILKRQGSDGSIELNGEHTESGVSDGLQQMLGTRGSVYLGGVPDYAMTYGRYHDGFSGCIYTLEVQDSGAIDIGEKAIRGINVSPCTRVRWIPSSLVFTDADADVFDAFVPPPPVNIIHPKPAANLAAYDITSYSLLIILQNLIALTRDIKEQSVLFTLLCIDAVNLLKGLLS
ncbi:basement membrane-specific heparan sulfate proteoglycan core protein [Harpegnathos saltator]|uniref:basement membrane-specific heparan sulfate proteoglycan core protein n=1 Tax=Harpegnathos saltator TaxID=610380 RepID=UPI000DBEED55|nr:basement membrane-specific heparan sulfate proteoglycan core protein [Harpegnathos saltator]